MEAWHNEGEERGKPEVEPEWGQGRVSSEKRGQVCKSEHVCKYMTKFAAGRTYTENSFWKGAGGFLLSSLWAWE